MDVYFKFTSAFTYPTRYAYPHLRTTGLRDQQVWNYSNVPWLNEAFQSTVKNKSLKDINDNPSVTILYTKRENKVIL